MILRPFGSVVLFLVLLHAVEMIDGWAELIAPTWNVVATFWGQNKDFLNSNFVTSVAGALSGAFFGAWAAQKTAERSKLKDDLLKEIRNTNAAIALAIASTNTFIAVMRQHVRPLKQKFEQQLVDYACAQTKSNLFGHRSVFEVQFDLQTTPEAIAPIEPLRHQIFEKITITGRPLLVINALKQSSDGLLDCIRSRNDWAVKSRGRTGDAAAFVHEYFGLRNQKGNTDRVYLDLINAIYSLTEDGIFFSNLIARDLSAHGANLVKQFEDAFRFPAPKIHTPQYHPYALELIPPDDQYADFVKGFTEEALPTTRTS